jgi:predicted SprT family Zn-dependent metalloprotease
MTTRKTDTTAAQAKKQAAAVQRITSEWWCQNGAHYTKAAKATSTGRRTICAPCKARLATRTQQARP